jgi:mannosyltransferase
VGLRQGTAELVVVGLLTAVALALRLGELHTSLIGDEAFTYQDVVGRSFGAAIGNIHTGGENSPPLFFALAWASAKLGDPTIWMRAPSVLMGTATVPVIYAIGRETVGRVAGLIGAAVMALVPYAIFYGSEARPYAMMTFFVALSTLALVKAVNSGGRHWWLLYVLAAAGAAYSHYTSVFVLGVQAVWSLWACRDRLREPLVANGLIVLFYAPWLPHVRGKALGVIGQLYPLGVNRVLTDPIRPLLGHPWAPLRTIPTTLGAVVVGICALAGAVTLVRNWRGASGASGRRMPSRLLLLVALALATPVGLLLYSLVVTDLWLPRGLSASEPAATLVLGALMVALRGRLAALAVLALMVTLVAGTIRSLGGALDRGPYRDIASYLDRTATSRDAITIVSWQGALPIPMQFRKPHRVIPAAQWNSVPSGGHAYMVIDDGLARELKIGTPTQPGFQFVARRHYGSGIPTDVLVYRR